MTSATGRNGPNSGNSLHGRSRWRTRRKGWLWTVISPGIEAQNNRSNLGSRSVSGDPKGFQRGINVVNLHLYLNTGRRTRS